LELLRDVTASGHEVFSEWFGALRDAKTRAKIALLCGGDKRRQTADIQRAKQYCIDYQLRSSK
jgi:putative component of toxin-antitoxin plasmid stabilization module